MYTDIVLIVILVALIYHTPGVVASLSTTLLGKLLLTWTTLSLAVFRGRNAGVLGALITILLQYRGTREGMESVGTETLDDLKRENDDCSNNIIEEDIEGAGKEGHLDFSSPSFGTQRGRDEDMRRELRMIPPTHLPPTHRPEQESFLGSEQIRSAISSSLLSLDEALRAIGSNKLPASSARGNGGKTCPEGVICPQSTESVKCGFFS